MADPGVNAQNFLRLLMGGAQQGANTLQQRQTMQQQQQPDLMLALQQMLQRKQMADVEQEQRAKALEYQHADITAQRMRQGGLDYQNAIQQVKENQFRKTQLDLTRQNYASEADYRRAMAARADAAAKRESESISAQKRLALSYRLTGLLGSQDSFQTIEKDQFDKMFSDKQFKGKSSDQLAAQYGWTQMLGSDGKVMAYRKLKPELAGAVQSMQKELDKLGGVMDVGMVRGDQWQSDNTPAAPTEVSTADDYEKYIQEQLGYGVPSE